MTSGRPFLLLRISFPGRPIFIQLFPGARGGGDVGGGGGRGRVVAVSRRRRPDGKVGNFLNSSPIRCHGNSNLTFFGVKLELLCLMYSAR